MNSKNSHQGFFAPSVLPTWSLEKVQTRDSDGTFNKVLFPGLRLAYVVLPPDLVDPFLALRFTADRYPPGISQAVLCDFIVEGHFGRHLRRMRQMYAERLALLQENARRYLAGVVELPPIQAGLNTPAYLVNGMSSVEAQARAADRGIETAALDMFALKRRDLRGLLLGFAGFDAREIKRGVLTLAEALRSTPGLVAERAVAVEHGPGILRAQSTGPRKK